MADNQQLATQIFALVEAALFGPNTGDSGKGLFVMCWPGIFMPVDDENTSNSQVYQQTQVCDRCLDASFIAKATQTYKTQLGTLSDWYNFVLTQSILAQNKPSTAQQAKINSDKTIKGTYESNATFMALKAKYDAATQTLKTAKLARSADVPQQQANFDAVQKEYKLNGGSEYDSAINSLLILLNNAMPDAIFTGWQTQYQDATLQDAKLGAFQPTYFSPPASSWANASWTHAKFTADHSTSSASSHSTSWSGGGGINFGFWSFGGGSSGSSSVSHQTSSDDNISIELDYLRVGVLRPWFHEAVFTLQNWAFDPDAFATVNSDGTPFSLAYYPSGQSQPDAANSKMPVVIEEMIVVRNVTLSGGFAQNTLDQANSSMSTHASFGWGPFSVSGSYSTSDSSMSADSTVNGNTITIKTPQVLGFFVTVLPQCPNPNPALTWQKTLPPLHK